MRDFNYLVNRTDLSDLPENLKTPEFTQKLREEKITDEEHLRVALAMLKRVALRNTQGNYNVLNRFKRAPEGGYMVSFDFRGVCMPEAPLVSIPENHPIVPELIAAMYENMSGPLRKAVLRVDAYNLAARARARAVRRENLIKAFANTIPVPLRSEFGADYLSDDRFGVALKARRDAIDVYANKLQTLRSQREKVMVDRLVVDCKSRSWTDILIHVATDVWPA